MLRKSKYHPLGQLTYERALRSILRQDPQVLMLGEIRDTAHPQLSHCRRRYPRHRLICTFHAATPRRGNLAVDGNGGLNLIKSPVRFMASSPNDLLRRSGASGRVPIAEFVRIDEAAKTAIRQRETGDALQSVFDKQPGFQSLRKSADVLSTNNTVDSAEIQRVLGPTSLTENCTK